MAKMEIIMRDINRLNTQIQKPSKFALGILAESRARARAGIAQSLQDSHRDLMRSGSELRYVETTLAGELSAFYERHEKATRSVMRDFAREQVGIESTRLEGMVASLASLKENFR